MNGATIGITAARRAQEQAAIVRALGGVPVIGSSIDCDQPASDDVVDPQLQAATAAKPDVVIVMTGIGARHTLAVAQRTGREHALRTMFADATVVARGSKARNTLRRLDLRVDRLADPPSSAGLRLLVDDLPVDGRHVVVICSGPEEDPIVEVLRSAGAAVQTVHPYAIDLPADAEPATRLAQMAHDGAIDAITFTSANAVNGLMAAVERSGLDIPHPHPSVLVTAVGPVTRDALVAHGWRVDVEPETPRMGAMYQALAARIHGLGDTGHNTRPETTSTD
jgi:uroporphyrinogen-III synthase